QKFDVWNDLLKEEFLNNVLANIAPAWHEYKKLQIKKLAKKYDLVIQNMDGDLVIVAYCNSPIYKSEIGNKIVREVHVADFAAITSHQPGNSAYSLRSINDKQNVIVVAKKFGGNGHRIASGCFLQ